MAIVKKEFKTPNGDIVRDKALADFLENGGTIGGDIDIKGEQAIFKSSDFDKGLSIGENYFSFHDWKRNWTFFKIDETESKTSISTKDLYFGDYSKSSSGYTNLPNGFILQWGVLEIPLYESINDITFKFPISFNNTPTSITGTVKYVNDGWGNFTANLNVAMAWSDVHTGRLACRDILGGVNHRIQVCWMAIGY